MIRYPARVMTIIKTDLNILANGFDDQQYMIEKPETRILQAVEFLASNKKG